MDKFDEKVIGYESTKEILRQILDILKRPEVYKRKGISIPKGLLMESDPGLGKSLLASILIGDMYLKGCTNIADLFKNRSSAIEQDKSKAREYYKKAAEHNQAEGAHKMVETTAGTVERAYWTNMAEKQGYKKGMKSWTSDIEEFNH